MGRSRKQRDVMGVPTGDWKDRNGIPMLSVVMSGEMQSAMELMEFKSPNSKAKPWGGKAAPGRE